MRKRVVIVRGNPKVPAGPVIFIANHQNTLDPFVIISALPDSTAKRIIPLKFIVANIFYFRWYRFLAYLAGCFPAHKHHENHDTFGIGESMRSLRNGYSFFIFPEGKRTGGKRVPAKKGIEPILREFPDVQTILARIEWENNNKKITITYEALPESPLYLTADEIMDKIYAL